LRELDLFFDHHPLTENDLRIRPFLLENAAYLEKIRRCASLSPPIPMWAQPSRACRASPASGAAPRSQRTPHVSEVAQLDAFLNQYPVIERSWCAILR